MAVAVAVVFVLTGYPNGDREYEIELAIDMDGYWVRAGDKDAEENMLRDCIADAEGSMLLDGREE